MIIPDPGNNITTSDEIVAIQSHFGYHKFDDDDDAGCFNEKKKVILKYYLIV